MDCSNIFLIITSSTQKVDWNWSYFFHTALSRSSSLSKVYICIYHKSLLFMCLYWTTISNQHYELKNFLRALPNKLLGVVFGQCSVYMKCTFPSVCMYRNSSACLACSCLDKIYAWWQHIMLMKRTSNLSWVIKLEVTLFGAYDLDFNQMQK